MTSTSRSKRKSDGTYTNALMAIDNEEARIEIANVQASALKSLENLTDSSTLARASTNLTLAFTASLVAIDSLRALKILERIEKKKHHDVGVAVSAGAVIAKAASITTKAATTTTKVVPKKQTKKKTPNDEDEEKTEEEEEEEEEEKTTKKKAAVKKATETSAKKKASAKTKPSSTKKSSSSPKSDGDEAPKKARVKEKAVPKESAGPCKHRVLVGEPISKEPFMHVCPKCKEKVRSKESKATPGKWSPLTERENKLAEKAEADTKELVSMTEGPLKSQAKEHKEEDINTRSVEEAKKRMSDYLITKKDEVIKVTLKNKKKDKSDGEEEKDDDEEAPAAKKPRKSSDDSKKADMDFAAFTKRLSYDISSAMTNSTKAELDHINQIRAQATDSQEQPTGGPDLSVDDDDLIDG
jgi:hypothetical protein